MREDNRIRCVKGTVASEDDVDDLLEKIDESTPGNYHLVRVVDDGLELLGKEEAVSLLEDLRDE